MIYLAGPLSVQRIINHYAMARGIKPSSAMQMRASVALYERYLRRPAWSEDLARDPLNAFLSAFGSSRAAATMRTKRKDLVALARFAHDEGLVPALGKVRPIKLEERVPLAYTQQQVRRIVARCEKHAILPNGSRGTPGPNWRLPEVSAYNWHVLACCVRVAWDTDCRISAVALAPIHGYSAARRVALLLEPKSSRERAYQLTASTIDALEQLPRKRKRLCGWEYATIDPLRRRLKIVLAELGLPNTRRWLFHCVRRAKYTRVAIASGIEAASDHAGHSSNLARFYLDTTQVPSRNFADPFAL